MDRRTFVQRLLASAAALGLIGKPAMAAAPSVTKVIGVGGAGCQMLLAVRARMPACPDSAVSEFLYVNSDWQTFAHIEQACLDDPDRPAVRTLPIGSGMGSGGRPELGEDAAWESQEKLQACLADAGRVILLAGLGGSTGSGVTPILARWAREAGAQVVAVVVMPFSFESRRIQCAEVVLERLMCEADAVVTYSNADLIERVGGGTRLNDAFDYQHRCIADSVVGLLPEVLGPVHRT